MSYMGKQRFTVTEGQRFGRGVVIDPAIRFQSGKQTLPGARLRCDCGSEYCARTDRLANGHVRSCGCIKADAARQVGRANTTHGFTRRNARHPLYDTWKNMLARCETPADSHYPRWGGRGIRVCDGWHDLTTFAAYVDQALGPRPDGCSLDRIDNDGHYEPGNVRWASAVEQRANQRR